MKALKAFSGVMDTVGRSVEGKGGGETNSMMKRT